MDNINMTNGLEKLLREAKIRNEFERNPVDGIMLGILTKAWMDANPENVLDEFHDKYFPKMNFKQMITFVQAQLDLLVTIKKIENEIDQNTKLES